MDDIGQTMVDKAEDMDSCIDIVHSEPAQDTRAKGKGKGIPQLGEPFGQLVVESGWATGWKVWVGDLPRNIDKVDIGRLCPGQYDVCVCVNNTRSRSGHALAVITFSDLVKAMAAFQTLVSTKFDHGDGRLHWPSVKWFGHKKAKQMGKGN